MIVSEETFHAEYGTRAHFIGTLDEGGKVANPR